tara:strand:+ start:231 stop:398 length:168 start_codon:yes stop_codon:yes gene_type:complete
VPIATALEQLFRCLHQSEGYFALLGTISKANLNFVLSPLLLGSLVLINGGFIFIV